MNTPTQTCLPNQPTPEQLRNRYLFLYARSYDPSIGRFSTLDPFGGNENDPQSLHKYMYANGNPIMGIDPSGLFSIAELSTTSGIQNTILSGTNFVSKVFKIYDYAQRIIQLIDTAKTILRFARAIGESSTPQGAAIALAKVLRDEFGLDNNNSITQGFQDVYNTIGSDWKKIAKQIQYKSYEIAQEVASAIAMDIPRYLKAEAAGDLQFIFFAPTGPGNGGRKGDKIVSISDRFAVGVASTGGRLFGFGVRMSKKSNTGFDQWFHIDYFDRRLPQPISVHYHVFHDEIKHPKGRVIWQP